MEVNINSHGLGFNPANAVGGGASGPAFEPSDKPTVDARQSLSVSYANSRPVEAEAAVDAAVEADIRRDDDLGRLFDAVMTLPPPPMPDFAHLAE